MPKFRKKPVVIDAVFVDAALKTAKFRYNLLPDWLKESVEKNVVTFKDEGVEVKTLEGTMQGPKGWWIIRGVKGEIYCCEDAIFQQTYDPCEEDPVARGAAQAARATIQKRPDAVKEASQMMDKLKDSIQGMCGPQDIGKY